MSDYVGDVTSYAKTQSDHPVGLPDE